MLSLGSIQTRSSLSKRIMLSILETVGDISRGLSMLYEVQSILSSVIASYQCRSAIALKRVQELEQEKVGNSVSISKYK